MYQSSPKQNTEQQASQTSQSVQFKDNREAGITIDSINSSPRALLQRKELNSYTAPPNPPIQRQENNTGLPDNLKSGIENLSGHSMDDVKVHYNSSQPAQLQAHAYAQGNQIHLGPGQEQHLAHEAWHVVQQKQGRVQPTKQLKSKVNINDDAGLEREADIMGAKAMQFKGAPTSNLQESSNNLSNNSQLKSVQLQSSVVQRHTGMEMELDVPVFKEEASTKDTMDDKTYGFLYKKTNYTRADVSGNADDQGYRIQIDHGNNGDKLDKLNKRFLKENSLPDSANAAIGCLEYVIGGPTGTNEETDDGYSELVLGAKNIAVAIKAIVKSVKKEEITKYGDFYVGVPLKNLETYNKTNGKDDSIISDYKSVIASLEPKVYVQVTAGVKANKVTNFMKRENSNQLVRKADKTAYDKKSRDLHKDFVTNRTKGYGLKDFMESTYDNTDNIDMYRNMLTGYLSMMSQDVMSRLLRSQHLGNWNKHRNSTSKNTYLMFPQAALSKIIVSSAPPVLSAFFTNNKESLKTVYTNKLKEIFTGGFLSGNKDTTMGAIKNRIDEDLDATTLETNLDAYIGTYIKGTVDAYFSEIGATQVTRGLSVHDFTFHNVDSSDNTKGNKIPIEFRQIKDSTISATNLESRAKAILDKIKSYNS